MSDLNAVPEILKRCNQLINQLLITADNFRDDVVSFRQGTHGNAAPNGLHSWLQRSGEGQKLSTTQVEEYLASVD